MAKSKSIPKLTLSASRDIPFNVLVLSQSNVRQIKAGVSIEELAEDIARRTLLQSLTVRALLDEAGADTGMYEIPAGGRRFRALELLVKQKRLAADAPIPCIIRTEGLAEEDSLAENIQRAPLHPLDQFRAFQTLREKGKSEEEIAAAFFVSPTVVRQRLKLASVAPRLLDHYAEDEISLDQLMAFTVNPDHQRQCEVWEAISRSYSREPYHIRRLLTEGAVRAGDKRARFVGIEAYEAEGGVVLKDLFADADDGWLQNAGLLNRLVAEKLEASAAELRGEGWKWIEAKADFPYGHTFGLRRIAGERAPLTAETQQGYDALKAELDALQEQYDSAEELPDDIDRRFGKLESAIEAIEERPFSFPPEELARAGVFVSIDPSGQLRIERGFVRPEDEAPVEEDTSSEQFVEVVDVVSEIDKRGAESASAEIGEDETDRLLSDRVVAELTAVRTIALRNALSTAPDLAMLAVLHAMALNLFYHFRGDSCLDLDCRQRIPGGANAPGLADFPPVLALAARHAGWEARLPDDSGDLWSALIDLSTEERNALFAHCAGLTVDASVEPHSRRPRVIAHAGSLASALGLDLRAAGWRPTAENYFLRVTKAQIVEAVREGQGEAAADRLADLKKADMAIAAEAALAASHWLPQALRTLDPECGDDDSTPATENIPATASDCEVIPAIAAE